ncbi:MAG: M23 family metallopeptidase [Candidatus Neomarinimicrobiota bacterium]
MKKPNKYTVLIIPDNDENNRQYHIARNWLLAGLGTVGIILLSFIIYLAYSLPKLAEFQSMQSKYNEIIGERTAVLSIMRDLQRIENMDRIIRQTLGTDLKFSPAEGIVVDTISKSTPGYLSADGGFIAFVENIPSQKPVEGILTRKMNSASLHHYENHYGIDIATMTGKEIVAAASGSVIFAGWTFDQGNIIILYHGNDYFTVYAHNQTNMVKLHDFVNRNDVIALAGSTGLTTGPHLHFEIWKNGISMNPVDYFPEYLTSDYSPE